MFKSHRGPWDREMSGLPHFVDIWLTDGGAASTIYSPHATCKSCILQILVNFISCNIVLAFLQIL